ncbi:MAG: ABC transporter ATP-binding protein/permease [Succinivibrionaceae bacterium]|nr:ABC transporter ATP-binding protein/permease [Succinivibrionaceae bacterium]
MSGPRGSRGPGRPGFAEPERALRQGEAVRRLWRCLAAHPLLIAAITGSVVAGTALGVIAPALQANAVDIICGARAGDLGTAVALMLAAYLGSALLGFLEAAASARLSQGVILGLRDRLCAATLALPTATVERHAKGDLMSRMTNDIDSLSSTLSSALPSLTSAALTIAGTTVMMLALSWQLTICCLVGVALTILATSYLARGVRRHSRRRQALLGEANGLIEEMVGGMATLSALNRQQDARERLCAASDRLTREGIKTEVYGGILGPAMNCINNLDFVIIAVAGGILATRGLVSVGVISAFIVYARQFGRPVMEIGQVYGQLQSALAGAERVFATLDEPPEDPSGEGWPGGEGAAIEFRHVCFAYPGGPEVISDFSLSIAAGQRVALVGATGSGKTTIASLLLRFHEPTSGEILVNGRPLSSIARPALRGRVGLVPQEAALFSTSVRDNLAYGATGASDARIMAVAAATHCQVFIEQLPDGLGTELHDSGSALSAGQRQLLAIARAFLPEPRILILDEATSSVDTRTESDIQHALGRLMEGRTCILIAHRLSTIADADLILVMRDGRIVESGDHRSLISRQGEYHALYSAQYAGLQT